jgi:hypothetical protein
MELDINHSWVRFQRLPSCRQRLGAGNKLLLGMDKEVRPRYLSADDRDFFAVISRTPLVTELGMPWVGRLVVFGCDRPVRLRWQSFRWAVGWILVVEVFVVLAPRNVASGASFRTSHSNRR